jgi:nucleoside-triphosphatase THEP1
MKSKARHLRSAKHTKNAQNHATTTVPNTDNKPTVAEEKVETIVEEDDLVIDEMGSLLNNKPIVQALDKVILDLHHNEQFIVQCKSNIKNIKKRKTLTPVEKQIQIDIQNENINRLLQEKENLLQERKRLCDISNKHTINFATFQAQCQQAFVNGARIITISRKDLTK